MWIVHMMCRDVHPIVDDMNLCFDECHDVVDIVTHFLDSVQSIVDKVCQLLFQLHLG